MPDEVKNVLAAFSIDHAASITGLSAARLARWDREGFFSPEYLEDFDRGNPYARVYSFSDLVGLRTLAILVDKHKISLKELRETYPHLARSVRNPWSEKQLAVWKKKVVWDLDKIPRDRHGQLVGKHVKLTTVATEVAEKAEKLRKRASSLHGSTERHRYVAHNAEVLAGTRIPVSIVQSYLDAGYTDQEILDEYPTLTRADIRFVRQDHEAAA